MNSLERRATGGLAAIFAMRMMGLALILPVFAIYAENLAGHTPFLVGLALGIYGLSQALLQIPFGMASDRFGRKPVILFGMLIFLAGSVVAARATTMEEVIIGRALQGAGAVAAAVIALLADLTRNQQRTKAMALVGMSIGSSFILALFLGPMLYDVISVPGIFWVTAGLSAVGIVMLLWLVPTPTRSRSSAPPLPQLLQALRHRELLRLDIGVLVLHAAMTAIFVVVPVILVKQAGIVEDKHWEVYLPVMLLSLVIMVPLLIAAERKRQFRRVFPLAIVLLILAQVVIYWNRDSVWGIATGLWLFFGAFNAVEALMPSLVSRIAPGEGKGAAIGVFSSAEFFGAFVGGAAGGALFGWVGAGGVFLLSAGLLGLWLFMALGMGDLKLDSAAADQTTDKSGS